MLHPRYIVTAATLVCVASSGLSEENRFFLINQSQEWAHRGFSIALESNNPKSGLLPSSAVHLVARIGDGTTTRVFDPKLTFQPDHPFKLRVILSGGSTSLVIDGKSFESPGGYQPSNSGSATLGETYVWSKSRTAYRIEEGDYELTSGGKEEKGSIPHPITGQLELFEYPLPKTVDFPGGSSLTFETSFSIHPIPASAFTGAIDAYGQATAADWPGKVRSDSDLTQSIADEKEKSKGWTRPADWDKFGGQKGAWHVIPTGFYQVQKHEGKWWLITPLGNPIFYTGIDTAPALTWETTPVTGREAIFQAVPPKTGLTAALWQENDPWGSGKLSSYAQHSWNLVRKFGSDWQNRSTEEFKRRVDQWGFSGQGKFCDNVPGMQRVETIGISGAPLLVRHVDVFDPASCAATQKILAKAVQPLSTDPRILGFSVQNEYEGVFTIEEIRDVLSKHADSPAAVAIRKAVPVSNPPTDPEIEKCRRFYADAYYDYMYKTVKKLAPNHLYFGYWISPGWWQNDADWDMIVPHCDIVGYDQYTPRYGGRDGLVTNLIARFDKPTLVGEFASPPWYGGTRGYGWYSTFCETDADSGRQYAKYVEDAVADPRCVGTMYFQYRDEPITGRGGGKALDLVIGEDFAFGLVDVTDRPKWDFVSLVREANLRATKDRLGP